MHCEIVTWNLSNDTNYDVLGGNAGAILVLLRAFELTEAKYYIDWAKEAGNHLINSATTYEWGMGWVNAYAKTALTGFAHGASGMVLAFSKLGYYTGYELYHEIAYKAFLFEQHYFLPEIGDWADLRYEYSGSDKQELAWCHGRGGILSAYKIANKYADEKVSEKLEQVIKSVRIIDIRGTGQKNFCLCHGKFGNTMLLRIAGELELSERELHAALYVLQRTAMQEKRQIMTYQERTSFGLMGGLAGIGYIAVREESGLLFVEKTV